MKKTLVLLTLFVCSASFAGPVRFRTPQSLPVYAGSNFNAFDIGADGADDLLVVASDNHTVRVYRQSDGTFGAAAVTTTAETIVGISDFNSDSLPDLLIFAAGFPDVYAIRLGMSNGTFAAAGAGVATVTGTVVIADFDGDGKQDVATFDVRLVIFRGDGAGGLSPWVNQAGDSSPDDTATSGDFDGDGRIDIAAAVTSGLAIAWNLGGGVFSVVRADVPNFEAMVSGDFDGDGRADLAGALAPGSSFPGTMMMFGAANRTLGAPVTLPLRRVTGLRAADLDRDGVSDLVTLAASVGVIGVAHGQRGGMPKMTLYAAPPSSARALAIGDFDGDGRRDVAVSGIDGFGGLGSSVVSGRGDGTLHAYEVIDLQSYVNDRDQITHGFAAVDVDGDGRRDYVTASDHGDTYQLDVLRAAADGSFLPSVATTTDHGVSVVWSGDIDHDAYGDVIVQRWDRFRVYRGNVDGTLRADPYVPSSGGVAAVADFTGDGWLDVLDTTGTLHVANAGGGFAYALTTSIVIPAGAKVLAGDHQNDGTIDVLVTQGFAGTPATFYFNYGGGSFLRQRNTWNAVHAWADVNGDGIRDYVQDDRIFSGAADLVLRELFPVRFGWDTCARNTDWMAADINEDGKTDLVACSTVFFGNGDGTFPDAAGFETEFFTPHSVRGTTIYLTTQTPDTFVLAMRPDESVAAPALSLTATAQPHEYGECGPTFLFGHVPDGYISFRAGGVAYLIARASRSLSTEIPLPLGSSDVTVRYAGTDHYAATSTVVTVDTLRRHGELTLWAGSTGAGEVRIAPIVDGLRCYGSPSGTTTVREGGVVIASAPAEQLVVLRDVSILPLGTHTLTADYSGDEHYFPATAEITITVTKGSPAFALKTLQPALAGKPATLIASVPAEMRVTGTVTFSDATRILGTANVVNGEAAIQTTFTTSGWKPITVAYGGDSNYNATTQQLGVSVWETDLTMSPRFSVTYTPGFGVILSAQAVAGGKSFDIYRALDGAASYTFLVNGVNGVIDSSVPVNSVAAYRIIARGANGESSPMSNPDYTTTVAFTDASLTGAKIKAVHVTELQTAVNLVRKAAGLAPATFTTVAPGQKALAATLTALRNALSPARSFFGLSTSFTDATLTAGTTKIKAIHLQELRDGVR